VVVVAAAASTATVVNGRRSVERAFTSSGDAGRWTSWKRDTVRRWRAEDEADAVVSPHPLLPGALHRLISGLTLDETRRAICESAASLSGADTVLLLETNEHRTPASLTVTLSRGLADDSVEVYRLARQLALEAATTGLAHSSLDRFIDSKLDGRAERWRRAGRHCVCYPLRHQDELVGALALVCLGRGRLNGQERWAIRRFYQAAALALLGARDRAQLRRLALTDPLTGVANRRGLELALAELLGGHGLLMFDFDDLKALNEQTEYAVGDGVLTAIGAALTAEAGPGELAARLGGDEFMLVVPGTSLWELKQRAAELSERLDQLEVPPEARPLYRGVSVGFALAEAGEHAEQLIRRASEEMRLSKRRRKTDRRPPT
jgi:diguanylate cyclase (GGDEF)-like protein